MSDTSPLQGKGLLITLACLFGTSILLAMSTILAKISSNLGIAPLPYLGYTTLASGIAMFAIAYARRLMPKITLSILKYWFISAIFGMAAPFIIIYSAVPYVGISFVALALTFPPLFTYVGTLAMGMERFSALRAAGVALALSGAAVIAAAKLSAPSAAPIWIIGTLIAPLFLAAGNVYRSRHWPAGMRPEALAPGMLAGAGLILLIAGLAPGLTLTMPLNQDVALLVIVQILNFTAQYTLFFILQHRGGPVMLSLIGAGSAIFGVPFAILIMGEAAPGGLFLSAALILAGVWLTTWGGLKAKKP